MLGPVREKKRKMQGDEMRSEPRLKLLPLEGSDSLVAFHGQTVGGGVFT